MFYKWGKNEGQNKNMIMKETWIGGENAGWGERRRKGVEINILV